MKKCPTCERTFEDNMRFCQSDGTALIDDVPVDPYKTMVASSEEIKAAMPSAVADPKQDDEVLQLPPEADPKKTMYASEEEIRKEMQAREEPVMDLPPLAPEPPKFSEPSLSPPSFGDVTPSAAPPPSPFGATSEPQGEFSGDPFAKTTPPIPSPFDKPKPTTYEPPPSPNFSAMSEPEPVSSSAPAPFDPPAVQASASAPVQTWEPSEPMQNAPVAGPAGQNKTLAIVSLVLGIVSFLCCNSLFVVGLAAIITGFMAKSKAGSSPEYGGGGLALGGIILGALSVLIGIVYWILVITGTITLPQFS